MEATTGVKIISSQETPGLGAKINGIEWQKHWIGQDKNYEFNKSVDAFAGATISPEAVYRGLMLAIDKMEELK